LSCETSDMKKTNLVIWKRILCFFDTYKAFVRISEN